MTQVVELLNVLGRWLGPRLSQMSLELAILATVVLVAIRLLRIKSPALRHLFWCLVLAKPVAMFLVASPVSLYWFLKPPVEMIPPPAPAVAEISQLPMTMERLPADIAPSPRRAPLAAVAAPKPPWQKLELRGFGGLCWLVVASALGLRLITGFAYVGFLRHTAVVQREGPLADLLRHASAALKLRRRVTVSISNVTHGPVLAGVFRPVILLPKPLTDELSLEQLRHVITHELAHVRRWDNLVLVLQRLAEMFLFFHPVVWLCGWFMRREAEAACDDAVIAAQGRLTGSREDAAYADSLTRVAEMRCGITRRLLVNTFAAAESNFAYRVRRLMKGRVSRMTLGLTVASAIALILIGLVGLPTAARTKRSSAPETESAPPSIPGPSSRLLPVFLDGKWGYINESGHLAVQPQFDDSDFFSEGLACVKQGSKWGYIDRSGTFAIEPQFDWAFGFAEGRARINVDGKFGYIDKTGTEIVKPRFVKASDFSEGLACVAAGAGGAHVIRAGVRGEGYGGSAAANMYGYIDTSGNFAIPLRFEAAGPFSEGLAPVRIDDKPCYIDETGQVVLQTEYEAAGPFSEGLAPVLVSRQQDASGVWHLRHGYIDKTGNLVIAPRFDDALRFSEGLARVRTADGRYGYIDKTGELVIKQEGRLYKGDYHFSEGLARVGGVGKQEKWGYIDRTGKFVIQPEFDYALDFSEGLALVREGDQWFYLDKTGNRVDFPRTVAPTSHTDSNDAPDVSMERAVGLPTTARTKKPSAPETEGASASSPVPSLASQNIGMSSDLSSSRSDSDSRAREEIERLLDTRVDIVFDRTDVRDVLLFLQETVEINIVVDERVMVHADDPEDFQYVTRTGSITPSVDPEVSVSLADIPLRDALKALLRQIGLDYEVTDHFVWVSRPDVLENAVEELDLPRVSTSPKDAEIERRLDTSVDLNFGEGIGIRDVIQFLEEAVEINIVLDERVMRHPGGPAEYITREGTIVPSLSGNVHSITIEDMPLRHALKALLVPLGLEYGVTEHYVWVSRPDVLARGLGELDVPPTPDSRKEAEIEKILDTPVDLKFGESMGIRDVLTFLEETVEINIVLDERVMLRPGGSAEYVTREGTIMPSLSGNVYSIMMDDVPLRHALKALLVPLGLEYGVTEHYVWVSRPDVIARGLGELYVPSTPESRKEAEFQQKRNLDISVDLNFGEGTDIRDVIQFLEETTEINIVLDERVMLRPRIPAVPSVTPSVDGKISSIMIHDVPLRHALKALLIPIGLDFRLELLFIWISRPDILRHESFEELGTCSYLLQNTARMEPDEIVATVREVAPDIKEPNTGRVLSHIEFDPTTKTLTIYNAPSRIDKAEKELERLGLSPRRVVVKRKPPVSSDEPKPGNPNDAAVAPTAPRNTKENERDRMDWFVLDSIQRSAGEPIAFIRTKEGRNFFVRIGHRFHPDFTVTKIDTDNRKIEVYDTQTGRIFELSVSEKPGPSEKTLQKKLDKPVTLEFPDRVDVRDVIVFLEKEVGINIVLDDRVMLPRGTAGERVLPSTRPRVYGAGASPYPEQAPGGGVAGMTGPVTPTVDGKVRSIVLKDIPAKDALKAVLYQMGLDYSVRPGFIWISRPDVLLSEMYVRLETRLYVLENADSMTEIEIVTILRNAMPEIVEPNTGRVLSYVSYDSRTKILILVNSSSNLDKGEQELEDRGFAPQRIATDAEHMIADSEASEPSVSSNTYDTPTP